MDDHRNEGWQPAAGVADMWPANDSRGAAPLRAPLCRREPLVSDRIRLALLVLVLVAFISARAGGALGATATTAAAAPSSRAQARVVRYARHLLGVRYTLRRHLAASGFDCSGLHALRLRALRDRAAALLGRAVRPRPPRLAPVAAAGRPRLLRRARPRRDLRRPRPLHPRAAHRDARLRSSRSAAGTRRRYDGARSVI